MANTSVDFDGPSVVVDGLKRLYETGTQSDFVVACDGEEWKVHKNVLYIHSDVLFRMSSSEAFTECREGRASLHDDNKVHLHAVVYYMYHLDYSVPDSSTSALRFHVGICQLAQKYNVAQLKTVAVAKFKTLAETGHQSEQFAQAAEDAYGAGDANRSMCAAIVATVLKHPRALSAKEKGTRLHSRL